MNASARAAHSRSNTLRFRRRSIPRYAILLALVVAAFLTRLLPVAISPLPYNNDSMTECRMASDIIASGHLNYPPGASYVETHSVIMPLYDLILAFVSSAIGSSPFDIAQLVAAVIAVLAVVGGYMVALQITRGVRSAMVAALVLVLLGTFLFFTGSVWKAALGMALFIYLMFCYMNRRDMRFLLMEVLVLAILPFSHHLAAFMAYLAIAYLTVWSFFVAAVRRRITLTHVTDAVIILGVGLGAYAYYAYEGLDRLELVQSGLGMVRAIIAFVVICAIMIAVFSMKTHIKYSFAPLVSVLLFGFMAYDYFQPSVSYVSSAPQIVLVLVASIAALAGFAWYGLEVSVEQKSRYSAIPLCLLLPFLTVAGFALLSGLRFDSQQIVFRSFDFADLPLALGIGLCVSSLKRTRFRDIAIMVIIVFLLVSLPFSFLTQPLNGVRHDTQRYETDAFAWLRSSAGAESVVLSDERLSHIGNALDDFKNTPWLPGRLVSEGRLGVGGYFVLEDEWSTKGVDDFPYGTPVISATWVSGLLQSSNVVYMGGPSSDRIIIFYASDVGWNVMQPS